ncbi:MAG: hypothetical protein C0599_00530 [Salinivirgaceae bacterium]|nr:MAG: hypothetical protein C0599_00530 [Salinivirgaceae bacterium]
MKIRYLLLIGVIFWNFTNSLNNNTQPRSIEPLVLTNDTILEVNNNLKHESQEWEHNINNTIHIGPNREIKSLEDFFSYENQHDSVHIIIDEGNYYANGLWINDKYVIIEGHGHVNLYCTESEENIMWIVGEHIIVRNIHMKHFIPSKDYNSCSGNVICFDMANDIIIENCDLNGCGRIGLYDNIGNSNILIRNNYIHNNSYAAYADYRDSIWFEEINDHQVFTFENNRMENNGPDRIREPNSVKDFIKKYPEGSEIELIEFLQSKIEYWDWADNPLFVTYKGNRYEGYHHIEFENDNGEIYDFGYGDNDYGRIQLFYDDDQTTDNPMYIGQRFKIYWEWRMVEFPCCEGEYKEAKAYLPSIVKLEMIENER